MEPVRTITGTVAPLDRPDVDTDQIIPKQFLTRIERTGFGEFLFHDWRGTPGFRLDRAAYRGATILAAGPNFGCGSSREHAVWALADWGYRAVIAPSLADIFRTNCLQVGVVPVELEGGAARAILDRATADPSWRLTVDVAAGEVRSHDGLRAEFALDPFARRCLLDGLDAIGVTLEDAEAIERYEVERGIPVSTPPPAPPPPATR